MIRVAREVWRTIYETVDDFIQDDCINMAASLAFYTLFSLAPLVVVILRVASMFLSPALIEGQLEQQVGELIGRAGARQVREILEAIDEQADQGTIASVISLAVTLFAATTVLAQLQTALNRAWGVKPKPGADIVYFLRKRLISLVVVLTLTLLLVVSLMVSTGVTAWNRWVVHQLPQTLENPALVLLDNGISWVVFTVLFAGMFKILPDAVLRWRDVAVGAIVTSALFVLGKWLIGLYLGQSAFGSSYGAAGSLAVVLAWVFYSSVIVLLGAEFTHVWTRRRGRPVVPNRAAEEDTAEAEDATLDGDSAWNPT